MTSRDDPSCDDELRGLLEKIAATAGDPPEHGLATVATLRRRRKRHRRGAVAAAMTLAVSGVVAVSWLGALSEREHDVSATAPEGDAAEPVPELPDVLTVRCSAAGIDVPVASIRPQSDGLHIRAENGDDVPTELRIEGETDGWDSGVVEVEPGGTSIVQPVAPGVLTVGCRSGDAVDEQRRVELVDAGGLYTTPELACGEDGVEVSDREELEDPTASYTVAVRAALDGMVERSDLVRPLDAYPDQRFAGPAAEPGARVVRNDESVAFVYLESDDDGEVWVAATRLSACPEFLEGSDVDEDSEEGTGQEPRESEID